MQFSFAFRSDWGIRRCLKIMVMFITTLLTIINAIKWKKDGLFHMWYIGLVLWRKSDKILKKNKKKRFYALLKVVKEKCFP